MDNEALKERPLKGVAVSASPSYGLLPADSLSLPLSSLPFSDPLLYFLSFGFCPWVNRAGRASCTVSADALISKLWISFHPSDPITQEVLLPAEWSLFFRPPPLCVLSSIHLSSPVPLDLFDVGLCLFVWMFPLPGSGLGLCLRLHQRR